MQREPRKVSDATLAIRNRMLSNLQSAYDRSKEKSSSSGKKWSTKNATSIQAL